MGAYGGTFLIQTITLAFCHNGTMSATVLEFVSVKHFITAIRSMLFSKPSHLHGDSIRNTRDRDIVTATQTYGGNQRGLNEETKVHPMPGTH